MKRREFITLLGGAAVWPLVARAQQPGRMRRIVVLIGQSETDPEGQERVTAFREGLEKLGWADGRNLRIDYRWLGGDVSRLSSLAPELVRLAPDVIMVGGTPSLTAIQR